MTGLPGLRRGPFPVVPTGLFVSRISNPGLRPGLSSAVPAGLMSQPIGCHRLKRPRYLHLLRTTEVVPLKRSFTETKFERSRNTVPTFNQLVKQGRKAPNYKTASPALQECPQRRGVGVEQGSEDRQEGGLGRSLLAGQHQDRVWTVIAQHREHPSDHQHEVGIGLEIEEGA